jgi:hypothetical protein
MIEQFHYVNLALYLDSAFLIQLRLAYDLQRYLQRQQQHASIRARSITVKARQ